MKLLWLGVAFAGFAAEAVFIVLEYRGKMLGAVILKAIASLLFVLLGVLCASVAADGTYARLIVTGLVLGAAGDICLNLRYLTGKCSRAVFMAGIASFLAGHLFYLGALIMLAPRMLLWAAPACAVFSALLLRMILKRIEVKGALKHFGIVYLIVVFFMASCALGLLPVDAANAGYRLFATGAVLFAASDVLLVFHLFGKKRRPAFRAMNLSLYYLGQILIALTIALTR
jgi:uncharacterized membrane protein YhhN